MTCSSTTTRSATRRSRFALTAHRDSGCAGTRKWILADNFHVALILPELAAGAMITSHKAYQSWEVRHSNGCRMDNCSGPDSATY